jgi:hypothetical protein
MRTLALFFPTLHFLPPVPVVYPSHPPCLPSLSLTIDARRAYSSTPAFPADLRSLTSDESSTNSSAEAMISSRPASVVSSLSSTKNVAAEVFSTPSLVSLREPYHQRPCMASVSALSTTSRSSRDSPQRTAA